MTASKPVIHQKPDLIFYGGPASGKTTQVERLSKILHANPIHVGKRLREIASTNSPIGRTIAARIDKGRLVSHKLLVDLLKQWVAETPDNKIIISDGAPRDLSEVFLYDRILQRHGRYAIAIYLKLPQAVAKERIFTRAKKEKRADDIDPMAVRRRIQLFNEESKEILKHYKKEKRLITINADQSIAQITRDITTQIKAWPSRPTT